MTPKTLETLAKLAKLREVSPPAPDPNQVELAIVYTKEGEVWNPLDHPRNQKGHFVKKGFGLFLFGHTKKAKYSSPGQVEVEYDLEPGDIAVQSPSGNLFVKHADGSWTTYPSKSKYAPGTTQQKYLDKWFTDPGKGWKTIDSAPGVEVPGNDEAQATKGLMGSKVGDNVTAQQMAFLPAGSQVTGTTGYAMTKQSDGTWLGDDGTNQGTWDGGSLTLKKIGGKKETATAPEGGQSKDIPKTGSQAAPEASAPSIWGKAKSQDTPMPKTYTDDEFTVEVANGLPTGTRVVYEDSEYGLGIEYTKNEDGDWTTQYKGNEAVISTEDLVADSDGTSGIWQINSDSSESFDQPSQKDLDAADKFVEAVETQPEPMEEWEKELLGGDPWATPAPGSFDSPETPTGLDEEKVPEGHPHAYAGEDPWANPTKDPWQSTVDPETSKPVAKKAAVKPKPLTDEDGFSTGVPKPEYGDKPHKLILGTKWKGSDITVEDLAAIPDGSVIHVSDDPVANDFHKEDGNWRLMTKAGSLSPSYHTDDQMITFLNDPYFEITLKSVGGEKSGLSPKNQDLFNQVMDSIKGMGDTKEKDTPVGLKVGDTASTSEQLDSLPIGTVLQTILGTKLTKDGHRSWLSDKTKNHVKEPLNLTIVSIPESNTSKPEPVAVPGKKNKLTAANPLDAPDPNGTITPVGGKGLLSVITNDGFKHPISDTVFPLEKGDQVLQHKITPESFAIMDAQGNKKFQVNKHGKKYKWSPHIPKSNYKAIYTAASDSAAFDPQAEALPDVNEFLKGNTFTHPASGLQVTIGENEKLLQHNFTPHSYLVVNDQGDMLYKIDVKGKKQKAGTNLKPSNYHEAFDGAKKPEPVKFKTDPAVLNLPELQDALDAAPVGDFLDLPDGVKVVKQSDGSWVSEVGASMVAIDIIKNTYMTKGKSSLKSDAGVPMGTQEFKAWIESQPDGTNVSLPVGEPDEQRATLITKVDGTYRLYDVDLATGSKTLLTEVPPNLLGLVGSKFSSHHTSDQKHLATSWVEKTEAPKKKAKSQDTPVGTATTFSSSAEVSSWIAPSDWYKANNGLFQNIANAVGNSTISKGYQYGLMPSGNYPNGQNFMETLGSDELLTAATNGIASLEAAKKDKTLGLTTSEKTKITKLVNKLKKLQEMVNVARDFNAGELPDYTVDLNYSWGNKKTWEWDMDFLQASLAKNLKERKFKLDAEQEFGGDPYNATKEQYQQYLEKQGEGWAAALSADDLKKYALVKLGAPGAYISSYKIEPLKKQALNQLFQQKVSDAVAAKNGAPWVPANAVNPVTFPEDPPPNTSQTVWNAVQQALSTESVVTTEKGDPDLTPQILSIFGSMADVIPPDAQKVLAKLNEKYDDMDLPAVVGHLVKSGIWNESALTFDAAEGQFPVTPGMQVHFSPKTGYVFLPKGWDAPGAGLKKLPVFKTYDGQFMGLSGFSIKDQLSDANQQWKKVYQAPDYVTKADAKKAGLKFTDSLWETLEANEGSIAPKQFEGTDLVALNDILDGHPTKVSQVSDKAKALLLALPDAADLIVYKDQQGHYRSVEATDPVDLPDDPMGAIKAGLTNFVPDYLEWVEGVPTVEKIAEVAAGHYSASNSYDPDLIKDHYYDLLPEGMLEWDEVQWLSNSEVATRIGQYMMGLITPPGSPESQKTSKPTPQLAGIMGDLLEIPDLGLGGGRPKQFYTDIDGNRYMAKLETPEPFRADTEHAAMDIARLFLNNIPQSAVRTVGDEYVHIQKLVKGSADFTGKRYEDLNDDQLTEAMAFHAMDWSLANHDTHAGQFLITTDGDVVSIDLGQSWKALGSDKLEVGFEIPGNFGKSWYEDFYRDVQDGKVDKERLDKVAQAALKRAYQISTRHDDSWQASLDFAFQNRSNYPAGMDRESFTSLAMQRKQDTFDDFFKFYEDLYSDGGYDFPFEESSFKVSKTETDAHLDLSEEFVAEVKQNKVWGKSLFFGSSQIEDAHAFFYTTENSTGSDTLRGELKLRSMADSDVMGWIKSQNPQMAGGSSVGGSGTLTNTQKAQQTLLNFAKTVSVHAVDGKYSPTTVAEANTAKQATQMLIDSIKLGIEGDPNPFPGMQATPPNPHYVFKMPSWGFSGPHEQQAWLKWAQETVSQFDQVTAAMNSGTAAPMVPTTPPSYVSPKGMTTKGEPKIIETLTGPDGTVFNKYSNWNYVGPNAKVISEELYEANKKSSGWTTSAPEGEDVTHHTGKKYEVVQTEFTTVKTSGAEADGSSTDEGRTSTGYHGSYRISSPDHPGVSLLYTPHQASSHGTNVTNAGRMQVEVQDWDGTTDQMDKAMELIRDMGVDLSPADETSLERTYWEQMAGILQDRKLNSKYTAARTKIAALDPNASDQIRVAQIKEVFAEVWGQETVDNADWQPKFSEYRAHLTSTASVMAGRPYWTRPDFDVDQAHKISGGYPPSRTDSSTIYISSGAYNANEEKIRFTGEWGKYSNSATSDRNVGSGQFMFFRQGQELNYGTGIYVEPHVMGRTQNYAYTGDEYGNTSYRKDQAPFDLNDSYRQGVNHNGHSNNEIMVKYQLSLFDDIAVVKADSATRTQLIKFFKDRGVNEIRGIPIEERIVGDMDQINKTLKKVWDFAKISQKLQQQNRGAVVGTVKTWEGKKFIKRANGQWVPVGSSNAGGTNA